MELGILLTKMLGREEGTGLCDRKGSEAGARRPC